MKHLFVLLFLFFSIAIFGQRNQSKFGFQIHPAIELNEIGSGIQLGASISAGFFYNDFYFSAYYFQNFENAEIQHLEAYTKLETQYAERGLRVEYVFPVKYYLHIITGFRGGEGIINNEILTAQGVERNEEERVLQFRPELGAELKLNPSMRLSFLAGYRIISGLEEVEKGLNKSHFNSLTSSLGLRFVF